MPESWTNTFYAWMRNIHDWCISRQLWWGHQIPAWYEAGPDGAVDFEYGPGGGGAREALGGPLGAGP